MWLHDRLGWEYGEHFSSMTGSISSNSLALLMSTSLLLWYLLCSLHQGRGLLCMTLVLGDIGSKLPTPLVFEEFTCYGMYHACLQIPSSTWAKGAHHLTQTLPRFLRSSTPPPPSLVWDLVVVHPLVK